MGSINPPHANAQDIEIPQTIKAEHRNMKIRVIVDGKSLTATLDNNATARDFFTQLPMTVTLEDYRNTEKIFYLATKLSKDGAPEGLDPSVGDITYYAPWGNIAIFYKDFGYSSGLVKLGKFDDNMEPFIGTSKIEAVFEPWSTDD